MNIKTMRFLITAAAITMLAACASAAQHEDVNFGVGPVGRVLVVVGVQSNLAWVESETALGAHPSRDRGSVRIDNKDLPRYNKQHKSGVVLSFVLPAIATTNVSMSVEAMRKTASTAKVLEYPSKVN